MPNPHALSSNANEQQEGVCIAPKSLESGDLDAPTSAVSPEELKPLLYNPTDLIQNISDRSDATLNIGNSLVDLTLTLYPGSQILNEINKGIFPPSIAYAMPSLIYHINKLATNRHKKNRYFKLIVDSTQTALNAGSVVSYTLYIHNIAQNLLTKLMAVITGAFAPIYIIKYLPSTLRNVWRLDLNYRIKQLEKKIERYSDDKGQSKDFKTELELFREYTRRRPTKKEWDEDYADYCSFLNLKRQSRDLKEKILKLREDEKQILIKKEIDAKKQLEFIRDQIASMKKKLDSIHASPMFKKFIPSLNETDKESENKKILLVAMALHDAQKQKANSQVFYTTCYIIMSIGFLIGLSVLCPPLAGLICLVYIAKALVLVGMALYAGKSIYDSVINTKNQWEKLGQEPYKQYRSELFKEHIKHQIGTFIILAAISLVGVVALGFPPIAIAICTVAAISLLFIGIMMVVMSDDRLKTLKKRCEDDVEHQCQSPLTASPSPVHTPTHSAANSTQQTILGLKTALGVGNTTLPVSPTEHTTPRNNPPPSLTFFPPYTPITPMTGQEATQHNNMTYHPTLNAAPYSRAHTKPSTLSA